MIEYEEAIRIVQEAIIRAGGYNEEHPEERTLNKAGLKTGHQRESFQRISKFFSVALKFKRGSLPQAFTFVDNQFSVNLEFKTRRGRG